MASIMPFKDEYLTCPYEASHQILKSRFQVHLVRCKKSHPNVKVEPCPFNSTHLVRRSELDAHVMNCPDKKSLERYKVSIDSGVGTTNKVYDPPVLYDRITTDEIWDDDAVKESYNPQKYSENAPILRNLIGATPSQKKAFREAERKRLTEQSGCKNFFL